MGEVIDGIRSPPRAIQIINNEEHTFKLSLDSVKKLLETDDIKDRSVVVISIAGSFRKGKSFLLNFFLKYLNAQYKKHDVTDWIGENKENNELSGFNWRGGKDRDTVGIWIWSEIFTYDSEKNGGIAIILMDTQGIFDHDSSIKDCISIFAISMLLSSVQCYNIMRDVQEDDLQHLELFMEYARLAKDETNERAFQKLLFIVRDWPFPYNNAYGYSQDYIDEVLTEKDGQVPEMRELRNKIKSNFDAVNAFLMPYPGKYVAQQKDFKGNLAQIDEEFVEHVKILIPSICAPENLIVKQINGENLQAREFVALLQSYVKTFDGNELPTPKSVLMATAEVHIQKLYEDCFNEYKNRMREAMNSVDGYFEDSVLSHKHNTERTNSLSKFDNKKKLGGLLLISERKEKLEQAIRQEYNEFCKINEEKKKSISSLKKRIIAGVSLASAAVAGVAAFAVTGPVGLSLFLAEAGSAVVSLVTMGSAAGGAGIGAGITSAITSWLPKRWFGNRAIENAGGGNEIERIDPVAAVHTERNSGFINKTFSTVQNTVLGFLFRRR